MSSKDMARRAAVEVAFDGVDITNTIVPYLLSLSYTDNEEDETDDLQIKLQDRDLVWLTKWLGATVDAAATVDPNAPEQPQKYTVNATNGLNVRAGPGTSYAIYGVLVNGSTVEVSETSGTWGKISYSGKTAYVSTNYLEEANSFKQLLGIEESQKKLERRRQRRRSGLRTV